MCYTKISKLIKYYLVFTVILLSGNCNAQVEESFKQLIVPSSGIWYNSYQPGTGVSMQFNQDGKWFAALYLYHDAAGEPMFLTMQGLSIDYSLDRTGFSYGAYAKVSSPIYKSENGRSFGCDQVVLPETNIIPNVSGEILFVNKRLGFIKFSGEINFIEQIRMNLFTPPQITATNKPYDKNIIFRGNGFDMNILALSSELGTTGISFTRFLCFECDYDAFRLIDNLTLSAGHAGTHLTLKGDDGEVIEYKYVTDTVGFSGSYNVYGIIDDQVANEHNLPSQIIIQQSIRQ